MDGAALLEKLLPNLSHPDFSQRSHWWRAPQITSDELACRVWFGSLCARACVCPGSGNLICYREGNGLKTAMTVVPSREAEMKKKKGTELALCLKAAQQKRP